MEEIIVLNGKKYWIDWDRYYKELEFKEKQEKELWKWWFSGQRTIDTFGVEGAKKILQIQTEEDAKRFKA